METDYGYQDNNRVDLVDSYHPGGTNISRRVYGYYPDGQMSWFSRTADAGSSGCRFEANVGETYAYYADGSLQQGRYHAVTAPASAQPPAGDSNPGAVSSSVWTEQFTYDAAGNRTVYAGNSPQAREQYSQTFNAENQQDALGYTTPGATRSAHPGRANTSNTATMPWAS